MAAKTPNSEPKRTDRRALVGLPEAKAGNRQRHRVRIERRSVAPIDADNFAGGCKALIDCLRQSGIIEDDDPESLEVTFAQVRVRHKRDEGTLIEIQGPDHRPQTEGGAIAPSGTKDSQAKATAALRFAAENGLVKFPASFDGVISQARQAAHKAIDTHLRTIIMNLEGGKMPPQGDIAAHASRIIDTRTSANIGEEYRWRGCPILKVRWWPECDPGTPQKLVEIQPLVKIPGLTPALKPAE